MTISVIDSASGMSRVLTADAKDRADLIRGMWAPMAGMYHFIPGGLDMATVHQQNFGFRPDSAIEQVREGLETLVAADAWTRIEKALKDGVAALASADPGLTIPDLNVLLVLGDPTSKHFVDEGAPGLWERTGAKGERSSRGSWSEVESGTPRR